jgi:Kyanoviridae head maturation protease
MKLIVETIQDVKVITEEKNGVKSLYITGPFLVGEQKNRNGRVYPKSILEREVKRYNEEYISKNRAFGELGHPDSPSINLDRVSHLIVNMRQEGAQFIGKAKILETPMGKIAKSLLEGGASLGVSSRGMGSLKEVNGVNMVQDDYYLATAADIVADPSAPGAFVQGIMEGKEWVWDNGVVKEVSIVEMYDEIKKTKTRQIEDISLRIFENFVSKL